MVGVPLGILAYVRRRLGGIVLGITGVVQTIPSLALLCFFIPVLGIGPVPALAVGSATIAALIGAGGFGEPISTGLSLNDVPIILQGALPAAASRSWWGLFALLEQRLIPKRLRILE